MYPSPPVVRRLSYSLSPNAYAPWDALISGLSNGTLKDSTHIVNIWKPLDEQTLISTYQLHPARIDEVVEFLTMPGHLFSFYYPENGQNTHGVGIDVTLMNLHLQLGQVGRQGSGYLSLRR